MVLQKYKTDAILDLVFIIPERCLHVIYGIQYGCH